MFDKKLQANTKNHVNMLNVCQISDAAAMPTTTYSTDNEQMPITNFTVKLLQTTRKKRTHNCQIMPKTNYT